MRFMMGCMYDVEGKLVLEKFIFKGCWNIECGNDENKLYLLIFML